MTIDIIFLNDNHLALNMLLTAYEKCAQSFSLHFCFWKDKSKFIKPK
jgi:hypothetical protein